MKKGLVEYMSVCTDSNQLNTLVFQERFRNYHEKLAERDLKGFLEILNIPYHGALDKYLTSLITALLDKYLTSFTIALLEFKFVLLCTLQTCLFQNYHEKLWKEILKSC